MLMALINGFGRENLKMTPKRGEIWSVDLRDARGIEISKKRPALIISNNIFNKASLTIIVRV